MGLAGFELAKFELAGWAWGDAGETDDAERGLANDMGCASAEDELNQRDKSCLDNISS